MTFNYKRVERTHKLLEDYDGETTIDLTLAREDIPISDENWAKSDSIYFYDDMGLQWDHQLWQCQVDTFYD